MKGKTFHALLLSVVMIAGAVTINDAFAQTNTERLVTVADTTADTNSRVVELTEIWNNFGNQFTPITDALNVVVEEITEISTEISSLSDDVMAANTKMDMLEDKLDEYAATRASDSAEIKEQIETLGETLPDIQHKISTLVGDTSVSDLADKVDAITTQLNTFTSTLTSIQAEVQSIQGELGTIHTAADVTTGSAPTDLNEGTTEQNVLLSWYAHALDDVPADGKYKAEFYFSCESDVFITTVNSTSTNQDIMYNVYAEGEVPDSGDDTISAPILYDTPESSPVTYKTNLLVDKNELYDTHSKSRPGANDAPSYGAVDFKLKELKAGSVLTFESETEITPTDTAINPLNEYVEAKMNTADAVAIDISNDAFITITEETPHVANKAQLGAVPVYSVEVNYYSEASDVKCEISPAGVAPLDNVGLVAEVYPEVEKSDGILTTYEATLQCDLNNVRITDVSATVIGTDLTNFVNMKLEFGDDEMVEFMFANTTTLVLKEGSLPIELKAEDLMITGDTVQGSQLYIEFTYDTVQGAECKSSE